MPNLTLNQAQRRNDASIRALSDRLLGHENAAAAEIARTFRGWIPRPIVVKQVSTIRNNADLRAMWVDNHTAAMLATTPVVQRMATLCGDAVFVATRRELLTAEEALGGKAAGRTAVGIGGVDVSRIIGKLMAGYAAGQAVYRADYRSAQTRVLSRAETVDDVAAQLWGSAGEWWKACVALQAVARRVSIGLANQVRLDAMEGFNGG